MIRPLSSLRLATVATCTLGIVVNIVLIVYMYCSRLRKRTKKYEQVLKSFSALMVLTGLFLVYFTINIGQDVFGQSESFTQDSFIIGMCLSDVISVMHWVVLTVEVHYHAKFINPYHSVIRNINSLIVVAWLFAGVFAGVCIYVMEIHRLQGIVGFFTICMAFSLFVYYATLIRRNLGRRNKVYCIRERNEAPVTNYKFDYIPTPFIINHLLFVSPWVGMSMYESVTRNDVSEKTDTIILFLYSLVTVMHPVIYLFMKCVSR